ncbi:hypothetical protein ACIPSE_01175 [Streptomyces sp. NPDC090106]|uniref:hypothetical protein n=1 Tax=Streptomyces sp. NPDC090106 TaxID=3365946 RepID=UPI0037F86DC0
MDDLLVSYGPERVEDIEIHDQPDGSAVMEAITVRPIRVFKKCPDGSLVELHGKARDTALEDFWSSVERFNNGENDS